jgi:hypothetical protein
MKVGVIQSNYLPWRGYFDLIDEVELFVFYDDVQYTKNDWRNRNRIKTAAGVQWLTVPVIHAQSAQQINETRLDDAKPWRRKHLGSIEQAYRMAPFFKTYYPAFASLLSQSYGNIAELNHALTRWLMTQFDIATPVKHSRDFQLAGVRGDRLLDLLKQVGTTHYLSGPSARAYLDVPEFGRHGIQVEYKTYDYAPYPQLWGGSAGDVSALDLLFNTGPEARQHLKSRPAAARSSPRVLFPS